MSNEEYISKKNGKYLIQREFDGVKYFFGEYATLDEAVSKKEWLDSHGWPVSIETLRKVKSMISKNDDDLNIYDPLKFDCNVENNFYKPYILDIVKDINFIEEDSKIPFPQGDDLNRFIFTAQHMTEKDLSKEEFKKINQIGNRIVNMYASVGFYLRLFERYRKDNKIFYKLTDKGRTIFESDEFNRNLGICRCILEHKILYEIFEECIDKNNISINSIVDIMHNYDLNLNSEVTIRRRAGCISSWMRWIFNLFNNNDATQSVLY